MADWRPAKCVVQLFKDVDAIAPGRSKVTDGTIGDQFHTPPSDHIPDQLGVVHAADVTHDPAHGADMAIISEQLRVRRDPRTKYIIFNERIASSRENWTWRKYTGDNKHTGHMHVSVHSGAAADDTSSWSLRPGGPPSSGREFAPTSVTTLAEIVPGQRGDEVLKLQLLLIRIGMIRDTPGNRDKHYGDETVKVIKRFQAANGLIADGRIGPKTWPALLAFDH
jgi:hypothetical protein